MKTACRLFLLLLLCLTLPACASIVGGILENAERDKDESHCKSRCSGSEGAYYDNCYRQCTSEQTAKRSELKKNYEKAR